MAGDPNQYQNIFNAYVQRTPDGRYFVPFSATQYGQYRPDDETGQYIIPHGPDDSGNPQVGYYNTLDDFYNSVDPASISVTGGIPTGAAQVALGLNLNGLGVDQIPGVSQRGTYNDQLGYYVDPQYFSGINPATTGGGKPNDIGLWQALSIIAPAAFGVGSAIANGTVGTSTAAGNTVGDIGGSQGSALNAGGGAGDPAVSGAAGGGSGASAADISAATSADPSLSTSATGAAGGGAAGSASLSSLVNGLPNGTLPAAAALVSGLLQANAAKKAAGVQSDAANTATAEQARQFNTTQANEAPFLKTATGATGVLSDLLGLNDTSTATSSPLLRRFTLADLASDPVYNTGLQFGLQEGENAINARNVANGTGYDSSATLRQIVRYANDYGTTKANDAYNRFVNDQSNIYSRLTGTAGGGQVATNLGQLGLGSTNAITAAQEGGANARAAGIVGGANAWGGAVTDLSSLYNNYQNRALLSQLLKNNSSSSGAVVNDPNAYAG